MGMEEAKQSSYESKLEGSFCVHLTGVYATYVE